MSDIPERFETSRLLLRRVIPSDESAIFEYGSDPDVTRYMDWPTHIRLSDTKAFIDSARAWWDAGEEYDWVITRREEDRAIGGVGCRVRGHSIDLGYVLSRSCWGQGYATEATGAVFAWSVAREETHRVWAACDIENIASVRVLEKIGMLRERILRKWALRPNLSPGQPRDAFVYSWVRDA